MFYYYDICESNNIPLMFEAGDDLRIDVVANCDDEFVVEFKFGVLYPNSGSNGACWKWTDFSEWSLSGAAGGAVDDEFDKMSVKTKQKLMILPKINIKTEVVWVSHSILQ